LNPGSSPTLLEKNQSIKLFYSPLKLFNRIRIIRPDKTSLLGWLSDPSQYKYPFKMLLLFAFKLFHKKSATMALYMAQMLYSPMDKRLIQQMQ